VHFFYLGNFIYFLVEFIWVLNNAKQKKKKKRCGIKETKPTPLKNKFLMHHFLVEWRCCLEVIYELAN